MKKQSKYSVDTSKDKAVMFFSASSVGDTKQLYEFGIREILVSYHYISKSFGFYDELLPKLKKEGGLFMTDSGGFSFLGSIDVDNTPEAKEESYWLPYLEKYTKWLYDHREYIYVAANLDLDRIVGRHTVDKWNEKYFKPLEKYMNIVYVAQRDWDKQYEDYNGLLRLKEYCRLHKYVGVNQNYKSTAKTVVSIAKQYGTRIHGFAWTSIPLLKSSPLFSCDSTTWLGGMRYGTSYNYDGKNFRVNDHKKKYIRKGDKILCRENGINYAKLTQTKRNAQGKLIDAGERKEINDYNLVGWLGARQEYLRAANIKLTNKPVSYYTKNGKDK